MYVRVSILYGCWLGYTVKADLFRSRLHLINLDTVISHATRYIHQTHQKLEHFNKGNKILIPNENETRTKDEFDGRKECDKMDWK